MTILAAFRRRLTEVSFDLSHPSEDRQKVDLLLRARTTLAGPSGFAYARALLDVHKVRVTRLLLERKREIKERMRVLQTRRWESAAEYDAYYDATEELCLVFGEKLADVRDIVGDIWGSDAAEARDR